MQSKWYINKLYISNFKPFPYILPLKEIIFNDEKTHNVVQYTILSGPNGYGKTTIFQAIEFVLTGKIEINEFKDKTRKYSEHISINQINKESIVVAEFWDSINQSFISIIRYNPNAQPCNEVDCKTEFKDFQLYIINKKFNYETFISSLDSKEIHPLNNEEVRKKFNEFDMVEWVNANYIKQEQSSNLIFKNNSGRVDFINGFIEKNQDEYILKLYEKQDTVSERIKELSTKIASISKINLDKELASIGEKPENKKVFEEKASILWDKEEYEEGENFDQYLELANELSKLLSNYEDYNSYYIISRLNYYVKNEELIYLCVLKCLFYEKKEDYLKRYSNYIYLRKVKEVGLLKAQLDKNILDEKFIESITKIKDEKTVLDSISTEEEKLYIHLKELREQVMLDEKVTNRIFDNTCPLCGNSFENSKLFANVKAYEKDFLNLGNVLSANINVMNKRVQEQIAELNESLDEFIKKQAVDNNIVTKFNEVDVRGKEILFAQNELEGLISIPINLVRTETELSEESILETVKIIINKLKRISSVLQEKLDEKGFSELFNQELFLNNQKYLNFCNKDNITKIRNNLEMKISSLKWYKRKQDYNDAIKNKTDLLKFSTELKISMVYKKKLDKIIISIRDAKDQYIEDIIRYIEIPLYVYSGKLLQTHQSGMGIFCNTGATTDKLTQFKLTTSGDNSAHDIINKFSSGQKAALNVALILAFRKIKKTNLDVFMIDDPCQSLDDINVASLTDILRNEFDNTQIIMSTHDMDTAGYMCYKYYKAKKKYNNYNVQKELYDYK